MGTSRKMRSSMIFRRARQGRAALVGTIALQIDARGDLGQRGGRQLETARSVT
jgi:hypothetical protein